MAPNSTRRDARAQPAATHSSFLRRLPRGRVVDRVSFLQAATASRRVVHVGYTDRDCRDANFDRDRWLHQILAARSQSIVGLDIDESGVEYARQLGYEGHVVDCCSSAAVQSLGLPTADVVVAGEVIEHLGDPGGFLEAAHHLTGPDGMLIVTTPNATSLVNFVLALGRRELAHHDHVSLYSAFTLSNAAERYGWEVLSLIAYAAPPFRRHPGLRSQVARTIGVAVLGLEHQLARYVSPWVADGLILVARPS